LNAVENGCGKNTNCNGDEIEAPGSLIACCFPFAMSIISDDEADFKRNPDCWYQDKEDNVDSHVVYFLKGFDYDLRLLTSTSAARNAAYPTTNFKLYKLSENAATYTRPLISLILEKGYELITVQYITDRADLKRGTLYLHYRDKQDLLLSSSNDMFNEPLAQFTPISAQNLSMDIPERHLVIVFQRAAANADFYRVMLGERGVPAFITRLRHLVFQVSLERLEELQKLMPAKPIPTKFVACFAGSAVIGVLEWWLENDMPMTAEELARYTLQLTVSGLYPTLGIDNPFA
jgi:AcrR family transcriptional regulator